MRRRAVSRLTPLELAIMESLWDLGPAPVQAVQRYLGERGHPLAYTTVQTMLNVLLRKEKVKRELIERAYWYRPAVTRQRAVAGAVRDIVDRMFGGSAEALVMALMETRQLTPDALRRLEQLVSDEDEKRGQSR